MGASASVIQEYYKAVDYWADIVGNRDWKLSVWIVGQNDVDLVDRFLEIERSPVGSSMTYSFVLIRRTGGMTRNTPNSSGRNMPVGFQKRLRRSMIFSGL